MYVLFSIRCVRKQQNDAIVFIVLVFPSLLTSQIEEYLRSNIELF